MIHEWVMLGLSSEIYFWVLWIFFLFSGIFFVWTGRRVWVHIGVHTLRLVHTIYYNIYTFYIQIFFSLFAFFVRFLWDFILITSLQERGRAAPYPMTLLQYVQCYIHGWRWYDGWVMSGFGFSEIKLSPINTRIFFWKINHWVYDWKRLISCNNLGDLSNDMTPGYFTLAVIDLKL